MSTPKKLFGEAEIQKAIEKIAELIMAEFGAKKDENKEFVLIGLFKQGVPLAQRIREVLIDKYNYAPEIAHLDISMYRDDFGLRSALPIINETIIPFDMNEANVILVDDVLSTGRTIRAALDAVTDYGRPNLIRLAVLVDRNNSEYPIRADYVGFDITCDENYKVRVEFKENDSVDAISEVMWKR